MSQHAMESLRKARDELLKKQRKCSWCGHVAQTADGLVRHILENTGDDQHDRSPMCELEREPERDALQAIIDEAKA